MLLLQIKTCSPGAPQKKKKIIKKNKINPYLNSNVFKNVNIFFLNILQIGKNSTWECFFLGVGIPREGRSNPSFSSSSSNGGRRINFWESKQTLGRFPSPHPTPTRERGGKKKNQWLTRRESPGSERRFSIYKKIFSNRQIFFYRIFPASKFNFSWTKNKINKNGQRRATQRLATHHTLAHGHKKKNPEVERSPFSQKNRFS